MMDQDSLAKRKSLIWIAIWLVWSSGLIYLFWDRILTVQLDDPDDYMRMLQVRDWLAGQSWFDVSQYRMNEPDGAEMHWSRFVDLPIGMLILLLQPVFGAESSEKIAMTIVPLLLLGVTMAALFHATLRLGNSKLAALAILLMPTCLFILSQFRPLRVDHHGWQIAMAAVALWGVYARKKRGAVLVAGLGLAFWIHISLEGLPYAVMFGTVFGLLYLKDGQRGLHHFLSGLTIGSALILVATRAPSQLSVLFCDTISWPLLASFGIVTSLVLVGDHFLKSYAIKGRIVTSVSALAFGGLFFMSVNGSCATDPFAELPPIVVSLWLDTVVEGLSIFKQDPELVAKLMIIPIVGLFGSVLALQSSREEPEKVENWTILLFLLIATTLMASWVVRTGGVAQLLAMPGIAFLIFSLLRKLDQLKSPIVRVPSVVAVFLLLTPINQLWITGWFNWKESNQQIEDGETAGYDCNIKKLNSLPKGRIFAPMYFGPEILYRTDHSVFISGYHRNYRQIEKSIAAFTQPSSIARKTIADGNIDYVYYCSQSPELENYAQVAPDGFAAMLANETAPNWLSPVKGDFGRGNTVWKVIQNTSNSNYRP